MIYYAATKNSEAHRLIKEYHDQCNAHSNDAEKYILGLYPHPPKRKISLYHRQGDLIAVGGIAPPEGLDTILPKNAPGWWFRRKGKVNMAHLRHLDKLTLPHPAGWARAIFGETKLTCYGLSLVQGVAAGYAGTWYQNNNSSVIVGVSAGYAGTRLVVGFRDEAHREDYQDCAWPKGLRPVKESTVMKWQEDSEK